MGKRIRLFAAVAFASVLTGAVATASAQTGCGTVISVRGSESPYVGCVCQFTNHFLHLCDTPLDISGPDPGCRVSQSWSGTCPDNGGLGPCNHWEPVGPCPEDDAVSCGSDVCGGGPEECDGLDNDGNGETDEGTCAPDPDDPCQNFRTDPVHVGTGAYMTHPLVDVRYEGAPVNIEFVRTYTSKDGWRGPFLDPTRLGRGWFHTFDERLFAEDARADTDPLAGSSSLTVVHRSDRGRGVQWDCSKKGPKYECTAMGRAGDPSLKWDGSEWTLDLRDGLRTTFDEQGRLLRRQNRAGFGWTVAYHTTGSFAGRIDFVEDDYQRRLLFVWDPVWHQSAPSLIGLQDAGTGSFVATFYSTAAGELLSAAESAAGEEGYIYASWPVGPNSVSLPYLTTITRGGSVAVSVTYDDDNTEGDIGRGRVTQISAPDGSYAFRYADPDLSPMHDNRNVCADPARSTVVVDLSTAPLGSSSCTGSQAGDAWCQTMTGTLSVCEAGVCREATCQQYAADGSHELETVAGNCPCGGADSFTWTTPAPGEPRRISSVTDRDGVVTNMAYDGDGRLTARCVNDDDTSVTTSSSSCPAGGRWQRWEYETRSHHANYGRLTVTHERSRVDPSQEFQVQFTYDSNGLITERQESGYTRDLVGSTVNQTLTWTFAYDGDGRLISQVGPNGESTTYTYHVGSGPENGMLDEVRESVGSATLVTVHASYDAVGAETWVIHPSGASTTNTYAYGGMRLLTTADGGATTSYAYDSAGRTQDVTEPSGRRTNYEYDAFGRVAFERVYDSPSSGEAEMTIYEYDAAGRPTRVQVVREYSYGGPTSAPVTDMSATYDGHGYVATSQTEPNLPELYQSDALGRVIIVQRGDGDTEDFAYDAFGRETMYQKHFGGASGAYLSSYYQPPGDTLGNTSNDDHPTQVSDPGAATRSYEYDDFGRLVLSQSADYGTQRWRYAAGRLAEVLHPSGKRSAYTYDQLGRVTNIDHDADSPSNVGQDYAFAYDNGDGAVPCHVTYSGDTPCLYRTGHLARVDIEVAVGTTWPLELDYEVDGQLKAELWYWPDSRQTTYEHDASGRLTRMIFPVPTGDMLRYQYDTTVGDHLDPGELREVMGELGAGYDHVPWAREMDRDALGRLQSAILADSVGIFAGVDLSYREDGSADRLHVMRSDSGNPVDVVDRSYLYHFDGMTRGWSSSVFADPDRLFFYDGGNRLVCAVDDIALGSCPPPGDPALIQSYTYDDASNRTAMGDPSGATTYYLIGNALLDEYPPGGRTIWYGYEYNSGGGREYDVEATFPSVGPNDRLYYFDGLNRVRSVENYRPGPGVGIYESHIHTVLYDHRSRPIYVVDDNQDTGIASSQNLFWDRDDELVSRVTTPDATYAPSAYVVDQFAHVGPIVGSVRLDYTNSGPFERWFYDVRDPVGLPIVRWEHDWTGATTEVWRATYAPFGERLTETATDVAPPWGFEGQVLLDGSDATVWNGPDLERIRAPLRLNHWRVYDPRVGQYLTAEPLAVGGSQDANSLAPPHWTSWPVYDPRLGQHSSPGGAGALFSSYAYAALRPQVLIDEDGYQAGAVVDSPSAWCRSHPLECSLIFSSEAICHQSSSGTGTGTRRVSTEGKCQTPYDNCMSGRPTRRQQDLCNRCLNKCEENKFWPSWLRYPLGRGRFERKFCISGQFM